MNAMDWYERYWNPFALVVSDYERRGIEVNTGLCATKYEQTYEQRVALEPTLEFLFGADINWGSTKQLSELLYDRLRLRLPPITGTIQAPKRRQQGKRPTGGAALTWLQANTTQAGFAELLEWKRLRKLESFFGGLPDHVLPADGRIHASLAAATETGRLSCSKPNLQQQPAEAREAFRAKPGHQLITLDYSGLEWRIMAHTVLKASGDRSLLEEIEQGLDPHSNTAVNMGLVNCPVGDVKKLHPEARAVAKAITYGINYGQSALGLSLKLVVPQREAERLINKFFAARPGVARFQSDVKRYAKSKGYVRSLLGRYRYDVNDRQALNVMQNAASDIMMLAGLKANTNPELREQGWFNEKLYALDCHQLLQVHDELVFEVPRANVGEAMVECKKVMETACAGHKEFWCPLEVTGGYAHTWSK